MYYSDAIHNGTTAANSQNGDNAKNEGETYTKGGSGGGRVHYIERFLFQFAGGGAMRGAGVIAQFAKGAQCPQRVRLWPPNGEGPHYCSDKRDVVHWLPRGTGVPTGYFDI